MMEGLDQEGFLKKKGRDSRSTEIEIILTPTWKEQEQNKKQR